MANGSSTDAVRDLIADTQAALQTVSFGRVMQGHATIDSTNQAAKTWGRVSAPEGAVVIADHQTAGRGRRGRSWDAQPGVNLLFSIILHPRLSGEALGRVTMAASVALQAAITAFTQPIRATIKWPNDILLEGQKCCGMLLEATRSLDGTDIVILGIGLNVNQRAFPPDLEASATSLSLATGRPVSRAAVLAEVLQQLELTYRQIEQGHHEAVRMAYLEHLHQLNGRVRYRLTTGSAAVEGQLAGVTADGALLLSTASGIAIYHAGELTTNTKSG